MIPTPLLLALAAVLLQALLAWRLRHALLRRGISAGLTGRLAFLLGLAAASLRALFFLADWDMEQQGPLMWAFICVTATAIGMLGARLARRVPNAELGLAMLPVLQGAAALALTHSAVEGLAAPPVRALLVVPAVLGLCGYFGASVGYLLWGAGTMDLRLGYESLVGRRFLLSKASPVLSQVTTISVVGVGLGVWLVLVSLGILAGFENDLQQKIIGANAHLVLTQRGDQPFVLSDEAATAARQTPGVVATSPFIEAEVGVASTSTYSGGLLFGIDPQRAARVLSVLGGLGDGSLQPLIEEMMPPRADDNPRPGAAPEFAAPAAPASVVIGVEMAKGLNVKVGDRIRIVSPLLEVLTPLGPAPKSLAFRVAAIFSSKMYEYDARYMYVSLPAARRFLEITPPEISGLQVRCTNPDTTARLGQQLVAKAGWGTRRFVALDWRQRNQTLFSALKLERVVAFVVLVFIILVASFSIVNTLTMSVIEKRREIAILKTMGARDVGIMKLFLVQGLLVGAFGTLIGTVAGVGTMVLLERFGFWIPGEVYYIDSLPVKLEATDVVLVVVAALLIVWNFAVFPALQGSLLKPVEGLRDG